MKQLKERRVDTHRKIFNQIAKQLARMIVYKLTGYCPTGLPPNGNAEKLYICMCIIHMCISIYVCILCKYMYAQIYVCTYVYECMYMYVCIQLCMYACMHVCMYVCSYVCI